MYIYIIRLFRLRTIHPIGDMGKGVRISTGIADSYYSNVHYASLASWTVSGTITVSPSISLVSIHWHPSLDLYKSTKQIAEINKYLELIDCKFL